MRRAVALAALAIVAATVVGALAAGSWPAGTYRNTDFFQFWASPHALLEGASPYDRDWFVAIHARYGSQALRYVPLAWASPYPLWTDLLTLPLALLPFAVAASLWVVGQGAAVIAALAAVGARLFRTLPRDALVLGATALAFEPLWGIVGGGNVSGFLFAATGGAMAASLAGRAALAGGLLALVIAKPHLSLATVPVFFAAAPAEQRRRLALGAVGVGGALALASLAARPSWPIEWAQAALVLQSTTGSNATVWTLDRVLLSPFPPSVLPALLVALAAIAFVAWWERARPPFASLVAGAVALSLFLAPHGGSYDQVLLLVPAAVAIGALSRVDARARVLAVLAIALVFVVLPWILYSVAVARGAPGPAPDLHEEWSALTPLLALCVVIALDRLAPAR